jgi:hypothetical protein
MKIPVRWMAVVAAAGVMLAAGGVALPQTRGTPSTVYVKASSAIVRSGPAANAPQVAVVAKGTALAVTGTASQRWKVRLPDGREGFIPQINTTPDRPTGGGALGGIVREDRGAGEMGAGPSMRGLSPTAEAAASQEMVPMKAVADARAMEDLAKSIKPADVDMFLKEGKVVPP